MLIKRINDSVNARIIQPYISRNFKHTKYGKRIASFYNKYSGKRCFFIGNGPSLTTNDLTLLKNNNEIAFAFNRIYNIFDETSWRPNFYISQDEKMLAGCQNEVSKLDIPVKFIPIQMKWYHNIEINNALYFNFKSQPDGVNSEFCFSSDPSVEIYCENTAMYTAAQMAAYMGFSEIYFIGVDHHFHTSINNKGEIVVDNTVKDYFSDKYNEDKDNLYIPNTERSTLTYVAMKKHCEARNIKVYNATRGGKLEVFPRVDFDTLF